MIDWLFKFKIDPTKPLLESGDDSIIYFTKRDLLEKRVKPIDSIWDLPEVQKILKGQQTDGSWKPRDKNEDSGVKYSLIETWRHFRYLIDQYEMTRNHPAIEKASEYIFSCQTDEGDIRGILANQYAPYYTGAIMALQIKAGYGDDTRIEKGLQWLLDMRQDDGGWVIGSPGIIGLGKLNPAGLSDLTSNPARETAQAFDWSKPFSAAGTGMILRAFAVHPQYRHSPEALKAARLLKSKLLKKDNWASYHHPDNWIRFQFPFWWTNIVSALDSISLMGLPKEDPDIQNALNWLVDHQISDGLWKVSYSKIHKSPDDKKTHKTRLWLTLAICRIFKRFY
ncbi:MAG: Prenyltransferase and squalene oxidase repeat protein [Methanobacterium sp. PtaU1.Bin097]|jgi:hypothetical protein|nr:MAG: Prenyltransferase and squalene oxidase repeat protein [Methanobacterium sp. PtaU1.Bin097]